MDVRELSVAASSSPGSAKIEIDGREVEGAVFDTEANVLRLTLKPVGKAAKKAVPAPTDDNGD